MIKQRFLTSIMTTALLCGSAQLCFAAAKADGSAAPAAIHAPASSWAVGPLAAKSPAGTNYCSMKNSYPTGQTLVFARDNQGSNSIALDFHKDVFQVNNQYDVKARVGSVTRHVEALAATKQVLVMQMGIDTVFYGALAHKHNVVFTIGKNNYGFEHDVSAADALGALKHCAESFQSGTVFAATTFPLGRVSDVSALNEQEEAAAETNEEPASPAPASKKHHGHKSAKASAAATRELNLETQVEALQNQNKDLLLEKEKTQAPQQQLTKEEPSPAQVDSVRDDMKAEIASEIINLKGYPSKTAGETTTQAATPAPAPAPAPAAVKPVENTSLRNLLQASHVISSGQRIQVGDHGNALRWTSDDLYGSAQQLPLSPGKGLTELANDYLHKTAALCKGEFAQKVGAVKHAGKLDVLEADITCLDGQTNAAAAVLFVGNQDKISVITQEGTIDQLTTAMSYRDAIVSTAARKAD